MKYQPTGSDIKLQQLFRKRARYCMMFTIALAVTALAGWQFDIEVIRHPLPHLIAMNPLSACCFLAAGIAFFFLRSGATSPLRTRVGYLFSGIPIVVGLVRIVEIISDHSFHLDQLIYPDLFQEEANADLARHLVFNTAVSFVILGILLLFSQSINSRVRKILDVGAFFLQLSGVIVIILSLYDVNQSSSVFYITQVSVPTAFGLIAVGTAMIIDHSGEGLFQVLFRANYGGTVGRILVPAAFIVPIVLGYLRLQVQLHFPVALELGISYLIVTILLIFLALAFFTSSMIERKDIERKIAEDKLKEINLDLERKVQERTSELSRTEKLFRALIEHSSDAIVLTDKDIKVIFQSPGAERMTGISLQHRQANPGVRYTHPDEAEIIVSYIAEAMSKPGVPISFQSRFFHFDGYYIWIEGVMTNLLNDPDVNAIAFNYRNVTERKKLEERQNLFVNMVDSSLDAIISLNLAGQILTWNKGAEKLFGYTAEEAIGKTPSIIIPGHLQNEELELLARVRRGERTESYETERITKDGKVLFISLTVSPILDEHGFVIGASKIAHDISERRETQKMLASSEKRFRVLIENIADAIVMSDENFNVVYQSPAVARITGYTQEERDTQSALNNVHPDHLDEVMQLVENVRNYPFRPIDFQYRFRHKDGTYVWLEGVVTNLLYDPNVKAIVTNYRDITQRRESEEEILKLNAELETKVSDRTAKLESVNKELEAFTYSVSHDLRAPLRIINGFSQILVEDYNEKLDAAGLKTLNGIIRNAGRMGMLIDDLLEFSRVGRKEMRFSSIDMQELVRDVIQDMRSGSVKMKVPDDIRIDELTPAVGDPSLIRQVWVNLISNAIKYSSRSEKPSIEIGMRERDGSSYYFVCDNGAGFDMQYAHKLFGVFQRLHKQEQFEGTGLGLALVKRIVDRHNGNIFAESVVDKGAVFYFNLATEPLEVKQ